MHFCVSINLLFTTNGWLHCYNPQIRDGLVDIIVTDTRYMVHGTSTCTRVCVSMQLISHILYYYYKTFFKIKLI